MLQTAAHQALLSVGFSRQEYWGGLPFSSSRGSFQPKGWTHVSYVSCTGQWVLYHQHHLGSPLVPILCQFLKLYYSFVRGSVSSVQFSRSVVSDSLWPHELQHTRAPCPSPTPRVHSNSCPSSRWCHPAISSSVVPFSSCPQSCPASESFPMSQFFAWDSQSTGVSALASVLPMNTQDWSLEWTGQISLQFQGALTSLPQYHSSKASILRCSAFFTVQLSTPYMTPGKTIALTRWTVVGKIMLLNMLNMLDS